MRIRVNLKLDKHGNHWKGGKLITTAGYVRILKPDHPFRDRDGYIYEHRLIWEEYHKAMLLRWGVAHHINGIKTDNRIENLEGMMSATHTHLHAKKDFTDRFCFICGGKPYTYGNYDHWRKHPMTKKDWLCDKCYQRLLYRLNRSRPL